LDAGRRRWTEKLQGSKNEFDGWFAGTFAELMMVDLDIQSMQRVTLEGGICKAFSWRLFQTRLRQCFSENNPSLINNRN
jgi:hypothetical protein